MFYSGAVWTSRVTGSRDIFPPPGKYNCKLCLTFLACEITTLITCNGMNGWMNGNTFLACVITTLITCNGMNGWMNGNTISLFLKNIETDLTWPVFKLGAPNSVC